MTLVPIDLKLFSDVKAVLNAKDETSVANLSERSVIGSFSYFGFGMPKNACDEVYPRLWLGEASLAMKPHVLKLMGITHVVNASMGVLFSQTNTSADYYKQYDIVFHGIPAMDCPTYQILSHLPSAADFIEEALGQNGKVYVHCQQGVSRSATVVIAFLMLKRHMDLLSAVKLVRQNREIYPNDGFLRQLCQLNKEIAHSRR